MKHKKKAHAEPGVVVKQLDFESVSHLAHGLLVASSHLSKWLITMGGTPFQMSMPGKRFGLLATYKSWDDPPSSSSIIP